MFSGLCNEKNKRRGDDNSVRGANGNSRQDAGRAAVYTANRSIAPCVVQQRGAR